MALHNAPGATRFVTNKMCPFAQKAWIALEVSKTPYELEEVSLYGSGGKPDWFWELNPKGTVPVLVCDGGAVVIPDSDLILDEIEKGVVVPTNIKFAAADDSGSDSEVSNRVKEWRTAINKMLPIGKKAVLSRSSVGNLHDTLRTLDSKVVGTYLTGDKITVADCHAFPFLWRINNEFGLSSDYPNLSRWLDTCCKQAAFKKTIQSSWWWWW